MVKDKLKIVSVRLIQEKPLFSDTQIMTPKDAVNLLAKEMRKWSREGFWILHLNAAHLPINAICASIGVVDRTLVHPREVFQAAILANAEAIVVLHNHPSGRPDPSEPDYEVTKRLFQASKIMNIPLLDHIIVGKDDYYSFAENRKLDYKCEEQKEEEEPWTLPGLSEKTAKYSPKITHRTKSRGR